jgi:hypothetical protein
MFDRSAPKPVKRKSWLARLFTRKRKPNHRLPNAQLLAVHMANASARGGMS